MPPPWNSLEVTKLIVEVVKGVLTPLTLAVLGWWIMHLVSRAQSANEKVIEKRLVVFDGMAPLLNDLFCYFFFVGHWKSLTPQRSLT